MPTYLIFIRKPFKQDGLLEIMLQGLVPQKLVKGIQVRLMAFRKRFPPIESMIPLLRVENGYWVFKSQCPSIHHGQIVMECFLEVILECGFKTLDRFDPMASFAPPNGTLFQTEEKGLEHCLPPGLGQTQGGDFKEAKLDQISSVELNPETSITLSEIVERSEGRVVFGVGWGRTQDRTSQMLGLPYNIDIDLILYICNKYGEVIRMLSPKGFRQLTKRGRNGLNIYGGIRLSKDCQRGDKDLDDERFVMEPRHLPPFVHSIVICLQIQSGAQSFRDVFDVHLRLLDTSTPGIENEHCAFRLDPTRMNLAHKGTCAVMGRILRRNGQYTFQSMGHVAKVAEQDLRPGVDAPIPSHVSFSNFRCDIPATDAKGMVKQAAQGYTDPYIRVFVEYWVKSSKLPTMEQMKGHYRPSHHGLVLKAGVRKSQVIVQYVMEGTPASTAGFKPGDLIVQVNNRPPTGYQETTRMLDGQQHKTPVSFLVFRDTKWIPLNMRMGGGIERKRKMLWESKKLSRVPCPKIVDFETPSPIQIQVASMTGVMKDRRFQCLINRYGLVVIDCMDRDRMSRDDQVFRHQVDMDQLFDEDMDTDSDWFVTSSQKPIDYTIKSNASFTRCKIYFEAKRTNSA